MVMNTNIATVLLFSFATGMLEVTFKPVLTGVAALEGYSFPPFYFQNTVVNS